MLEYLYSWSSHPVGQLHVSLALLALLLGPVVFLGRKGTKTHRALGYLYVLAMLIMNITALARYGLTQSFNLFHAAALISLATLLPAWFCAWRASITGSKSLRIAHGIFMSWTYFGLVMALFAELVTRRFPSLLHGEGSWTRFGIWLGVTMLIAGVLVHRLIQARIVRGPTLQQSP